MHSVTIEHIVGIGSSENTVSTLQRSMLDVISTFACLIRNLERRHSHMVLALDYEVMLFQSFVPGYFVAKPLDKSEVSAQYDKVSKHKEDNINKG